MLRATARYYIVNGVKVGRIVFTRTTVGCEFNMTIDIRDGYKQCFEEMLECLKERDPYTFEIQNSDMCINYSGGNGRILFASGGDGYDLVWSMDVGQMIKCVSDLLMSDVWDYSLKKHSWFGWW